MHRNTGNHHSYECTEVFRMVGHALLLGADHAVRMQRHVPPLPGKQRRKEDTAELRPHGDFLPHQRDADLLRADAAQEGGGRKDLCVSVPDVGTLCHRHPEGVPPKGTRFILHLGPVHISVPGTVYFAI